MRPPYSPLHFFILLGLISILFILIQIQIFSIVLDKLGLSPGSAILLLFVTLIGSGINLPLFILHGKVDEQPTTMPRPWFFGPVRPYQGKTVIAINVGGALVPVLFSIYLMQINTISLFTIIIAISSVAAISYVMSRPIQGMGIGMPIFIAPLTAALVAIIMEPEQSAPLAYICGTLGVLIGADILRLKDIPKLAAPVASIGGAGTFDGIFFTGIIAVLLA